MKKVILFGGIALLLAAYGLSYSALVDLRLNQPPETKRVQALAVDARLLKVISGPFKGIAADYLILKASIFMGGAREVTQEDWDAVYRLLKQSLYLDPMFFQTGYYTQGLLAWRKGMHAKAVELLKSHAEHRYWDWEPMFYLGFDYFYYLKDNESAAKYLKLAAERPGAPPIASSLAARLAQKVGQTPIAIALLKTMLENTQGDQSRAYYAKRLEAYQALYLLEQAVAVYKKFHGHPPQTLPDVVDAGIINEMPSFPSDYSLQYDPGTGTISLIEDR